MEAERKAAAQREAGEGRGDVTKKHEALPVWKCRRKPSASSNNNRKISDQNKTGIQHFTPIRSHPLLTFRGGPGVIAANRQRRLQRGWMWDGVGDQCSYLFFLLWKEMRFSRIHCWWINILGKSFSVPLPRIVKGGEEWLLRGPRVTQM